jgi:hypothetical protein
MHIQVEYHDDQKFQSHDLTSWLRISKMILDNIWKM